MAGIKAHKMWGYIKRNCIARFSSDRKKKITNVFEYKEVVYTIDSNHKHKFDIYVPATAGDKVFPIMLYFHGGRYMTGDKVERSAICKKLASLGMVVFNVNYSLVPKYNLSQIEADVVLAMEEAMNIAVLHNGDYNQVYLAGDEVGAGLITRVVSNIRHGVYAEYLGGFILGTLNIAGRYDLSRMKYRVQSVESKIVDILIDELHNPEDYDAENYIDEYYPETVVVCGKQDEYFEDSQNYVASLKKHGVEHTFINSKMNWGQTLKALVDKNDSTMFNELATAVKKMLENGAKLIEDGVEVVDNSENTMVEPVKEVKPVEEKTVETKKTTKSTTKKTTTAKKTTKTAEKKAATKSTAKKSTATKKPAAAKKTTTKKTATKKATK